MTEFAFLVILIAIIGIPSIFNSGAETGSVYCNTKRFLVEPEDETSLQDEYEERIYIVDGKPLCMPKLYCHSLPAGSECDLGTPG